MPVIETLAYQPKDMDEFIAFVIDGKRENGVHVTIGGRKVTGVLSWLHARKVQRAHFFNSAKGNDLQFFLATVEKPASEPVEDDRPWMKEIPGFDSMVVTDGLIGKRTDFAPIGTLLASVKSNPVLDQEFVTGKTRVDQVLEAIQSNGGDFSFREKDLRAALRGDEGSDPQTLFAEVERIFGFSL